jgi:molybdopterin synthase catalytic subunit
VRLTREPIDLGALLGASPEDGAVAVFVGVVRGTNRGLDVRSLEYEAYEEMAVAEVEAIVLEAKERFAVTEVQVVHRLGLLAVGDASVAVAVRAPHRAPAFDACRFTIDAVKLRVPIWKKETYESGSSWVDGEVVAPSSPT